MEEDLRSLLLAAPDVATAVDARITWGLHPQGAARPALVMHVRSDVVGNTNAGQDTLAMTRVQIDAQAETFKQATQLSRAVRSALAGFSGQQGSTYFDGIFRAFTRTTAEHTKTAVIHTVINDFEVWHRPA